MIKYQTISLICILRGICTHRYICSFAHGHKLISFEYKIVGLDLDNTLYVDPQNLDIVAGQNRHMSYMLLSQKKGLTDKVVRLTSLTRHKLGLACHLGSFIICISLERKSNQNFAPDCYVYHVQFFCVDSFSMYIDIRYIYKKLEQLIA